MDSSAIKYKDGTWIAQNSKAYQLLIDSKKGGETGHKASQELESHMKQLHQEEKRRSGR